jgi:hypothetical protein
MFYIVSTGMPEWEFENISIKYDIDYFNDARIRFNSLAKLEIKSMSKVKFRTQCLKARDRLFRNNYNRKGRI